MGDAPLAVNPRIRLKLRDHKWVSRFKQEQKRVMLWREM